MADLGIAILGAGAMGNTHAQAWKGYEGAKIIAIADLDEERLNKAMADHDIPEGSKEWADVIALEEVDAVSVCLPSYLHCDATVAAAEHGKHVLCEKPISMTLQQADDMIAAAKANDVVLMSTDLSLTPREITMLYADRFAIEMTFRELKQHFGLGHYQLRVPRAILRHVHLSGIACSLTQLLTLRPIRDRLCHGILNWRPMPWRKRNTPISVRETQRLLRQACELEWTFALVPHTGGHINKSALAELSPLRSPKCAGL